MRLPGRPYGSRPCCGDVGDAIEDGRVYRINLRSYLNATAELRSGADWRIRLEQDFLPETDDEYESDEEALRAWFLKGGKADYSVREICNGLRRFRGQTGPVTDLVRKMVAAGTLVEIPPKPRSGRGPGRPAGSRFRLAT